MPKRVKITTEARRAGLKQMAREEALLSTPAVLTYTLEEIGLPPWIRNRLHDDNIYSVDKLVRLGARYVSRIPRIGPKAMQKICVALKSHDLTLGMTLGVDPEHEPVPVPPHLRIQL